MRWPDGRIKSASNCKKIAISYIYIPKINVYLFWDGPYKSPDNWLNGILTQK